MDRKRLRIVKVIIKLDKFKFNRFIETFPIQLYPKNYLKDDDGTWAWDIDTEYYLDKNMKGSFLAKCYGEFDGKINYEVHLNSFKNDDNRRK